MSLGLFGLQKRAKVKRFETGRRFMTAWTTAWQRFSEQTPGSVRVALLWLLLLYGAVFCAGWLAPYPEAWSNRRLALAPPTPIYWRNPATGGFCWPYRTPLQKHFDPEQLRFEFEPNLKQPVPIRLQGWPRLMATTDAAPLHLLGTDTLGRDNFSRMLYGGRVSLTVGLVALLLSTPLGVIIGAFSGYLGGKVDTLIMRFSEILMAVPTLFLLISLASLLPDTLGTVERFVLLIGVLCLFSWTGLARVIRGMVLSLKEREFIQAERTLGATQNRILIKHLIPQTFSYLWVAVTLGIPGALLAESALSFLGLGIQPPSASWGLQLKEAQDISHLIERPWMLMPGLLILTVVLAFNTLGEYLRKKTWQGVT
jgi:peptide/nickel transport system permease protein